MKINEILNSDEFIIVKNEVERFVDDIQNDYLDRVENSLNDIFEKELFDSIWGPVEFNKGEIIILDSPLLQRLRKIKQLGLANYVYCGADYSRFDHTVGVFYLSGKMANIIDKKINDNKEGYFNQIVRLAALFHDVGHMYFSHVSEYFFSEMDSFSRHEEIKRMIMKFGNCIDHKPSLHEIISVLIVNSTPVKDMLKKAAQQFDITIIKTPRDLEEVVEYISCLILGIANNPNLLPYYQIINGPIDADKCDYLTRDSHATNVPVAVDIFRLIHKLSVVPKTSVSFDNDIWNSQSSTVFNVPAINSSAIEAFNQLIMAKNIMHRSVYHHHKVQTAEVMMREVFRYLDSINIKEVNNFYNILKTTDNFFDFNILSIIYNKNTSVEMQLALNLLNRINNRVLFKRASSLSISNLKIIDRNRNYNRFQNNILDVQDSKERLLLYRKVKEEYKKVCKIFNYHFKKEDIEFLIIDSPNMSFSALKSDTFVIYGNGTYKKTSEIFQVDAWMGSKESRERELYFITNSSRRDLVFISLQKAIYDLYGVAINDKSSASSKTSLIAYEEEKEKLFLEDYYSNALILVLDLVMKKYKSRITDLSMKFQTFEGRDDNKITDDKIYDFISQFFIYEFKNKEIDLFVDGLLRILENSLFIDRQQVVSSMKKIIKNNEMCDKVLHLCPLGNERDSALHIMYFLNDANFTNLYTYKSVEEMLEKDINSDEIIAFFDDGAYSGRQLISIFQSYLNIEENRLTDEEHVNSLNNNYIEKLRSRKIYFIYICFNSKNKDYISSQFKKMDLNIEVIYDIDLSKKIFDENENFFKNSEQLEIVKEKLTFIGEQIVSNLKNGKSNWSTERIKNAALGYNDSQQMVILKSSVPTYSLTPMWMDGAIINNNKWHPLFMRTIKK